MIRNWSDLYLEDAFNQFGTRSRQNVERWQFNCAGYAMNTYNWLCPYDTEEDSERLFDDWYGSMSSNEKLEETVEWMLERIPDLRRVNGVDDLEDDEYLIAYKCGHSDFHYCKRLPNGQWWHKPGSGRTRRIAEHKVYARTWSDGKYDSDTVFLAKKIRK
jgi:hypothetical protein